jgi:hypothetical protein
MPAKAAGKSGDWRAYLGSIAAESTARVDRVRHLIGDRHWLSAGEWHESIVRSLLRAHLPERFEVSTGFVRWHEDIVSRQLDVLVWDRLRTAPLLRDGEFVILPADGVVAVLEVKTTLTPATLRDALDVLHHEAWRSYSNLLHGPGGEDKRPIRGIVAFRSGRSFRSPATTFDVLTDFYRTRFEGSRGVMAMRLGVTNVNTETSTFGEFAEFDRPRFVNLVDAITVADGNHIEQCKVWAGGDGPDPAFLALAGRVDGHGLALARLMLLMRDLVNRRVEAPGYSGWALRRDMLKPFASPALGTFGGTVDAAKLGLAGDQVWRPTAPLW